MTTKQAWISFWLVGIIWGSSYLFIRVAVEQLPPFELVFIRTGIAAVGLTIIAYLRGKRFPRDWAGIRDLIAGWRGVGVGHAAARQQHDGEGNPRADDEHHTLARRGRDPPVRHRPIRGR